MSRFIAASREDGHKWEPCLHHEERLRSSSLADPCFDIYYHHREIGMKVVDPQPIPYAFVVSLKAPKVKDLYNRVVRAYAQQLVPLRPQTRIQVRTWRAPRHPPCRTARRFPPQFCCCGSSERCGLPEP